MLKITLLLVNKRSGIQDIYSFFLGQIASSKSGYSGVSGPPASSELCHTPLNGGICGPVFEHLPWQTECNGSELVWLLRLHPKRWYSFCLPLFYSLATHPWNLAVMLEGSPGLKERPPVGVLAIYHTKVSGDYQHKPSDMWLGVPVDDSNPSPLLPAFKPHSGTKMSHPLWALPKLQIFEQNKYCCFKSQVLE